MRDAIRWGRTEIPYIYKFAARKSLAIRVHPDLTVEVLAPHHVSLEVIRERVAKRGAWIRNAWREFELYLPRQPERRYISGETHRYLGRQYRLRVELGDEDSVKCLRGYLHVTSRGEPSPRRVQELLDAWYRRHAHRIFHERLDECYRRALLWDIKKPPLFIRRMKTRWGSCSDQGRIYLNLELIKASKECIDYVITHELCHLQVPSHGPKFWRLLAKLMPDYEARKGKLNLFADV